MCVHVPFRRHCPPRTITRLRPLELNHRDVVSSLLNLVYEGLFEIDDNAQPQPELAYAYNFSNDGRKFCRSRSIGDDIILPQRPDMFSPARRHGDTGLHARAGRFRRECLDSVRCPSPTAACITRTFYSRFCSWRRRTIKHWYPYDTRRRGQLWFALRVDLPDSGVIFAQVAADMPSGTGRINTTAIEQGSAISADRQRRMVEPPANHENKS